MEAPREPGGAPPDVRASDPQPDACVFVACSECGVVIALYDSVGSWNGRQVCWECGVGSLTAASDRRGRRQS